MNKLFVCALLGSISCLTNAADCVKVTMSVMRNQSVNHSSTHTLQKGMPAEIIYMDTSTYVEAEIVSLSPEEVEFMLLISSRSENGAFVVRGMPKMTVHLTQGLGMSSLNCNGRDEQFTLLAAASIAQ